MSSQLVGGLCNAFGSGALLGLTAGGSAPLSAIDAFIATVGSANVDYFYHRTRFVVASAGNLVSWDDVRGSTFAPTLVPIGTTPPTVSAGSVDTTGLGSTNGPTLGNLVASATFRGDADAYWRVLIAELDGTPNYWGGVSEHDASVSSGDYRLIGYNGAQTYVRTPGGTNAVSPTALRAPGVRSCLIESQNIPYWYETSPTRTLRYEFMGRGVSRDELASTFSTGFLTIGGIWNIAVGAIKARAIFGGSGPLTPAIRRAIETLIQDATLADTVTLFTGATDSTGQIICLGDSLTFGQNASTVTATTPANPVATSYPGRLQNYLNAGSKTVDVVPLGLSGQTLVDLVTPQGAATTSYLQDWCAHLSPARQAAGLADVLALWAGVNDITTGISLATMQATALTAVAMVHSAGGKISMQTTIPWAGYFGTAQETQRLAWNAWLLANTAGFDLVIDMSQIADPGNGGYHPYQDPSGGSDTVTTNLLYYHTVADPHQTDLGYDLIGHNVYTRYVAAGWI